MLAGLTSVAVLKVDPRMFELIEMAGTPEISIALETRLRRPVANSQPAAPDQRALQKFQRLCNAHDRWVRRKEPCGIYNCFGHVWASRRTAIYWDEEVAEILIDDGYVEIPEGEATFGDIALYFEPVSKMLLHAGIVNHIEALAGTTQAIGKGVPWILSKLDPSSGEVLHHFRDPPYKADEYAVVFITDRHNSKWTTSTTSLATSSLIQSLRSRAQERSERS
jgi:hypothetical protein